MSWNPPTPLGDTTGYKVVYGDGSNSVVVSDGYTDNISLTGLVSGASYTISLIAKSQHLSSASITTQVTLSEAPCIEPNSIIIFYFVQYHCLNSQLSMQYQ